MITPEQLLVYARKLVGEFTPEVQLRSSISRAYYSAYHYCKLAADKYCDNLSPGEKEKIKGGEHKRLYIRMEKKCREAAVSEKLRTMAEQAKKLRDLRTKADYELGINIVPGEAERSFKYAGQVESQAKKL